MSKTNDKCILCTKVIYLSFLDISISYILYTKVISVVSIHFYILHFVHQSHLSQINDFGGRNVGNGNVQKRQINDFEVQNAGNRNV
jgi:hypothetical protein